MNLKPNFVFVVETHIGLKFAHLVRNVLGTIGINQRVPALVSVPAPSKRYIEKLARIMRMRKEEENVIMTMAPICRTDMSDHHSVTIAT